MKILSLILLLHMTISAGCLPIESDELRAGDLARAVPAFANIPPAERIALAPMPGLHRSFAPIELKRLAHQHGVEMEAQAGVCFEYPTRSLDRQAVIAALAAGADSPGIEIELVEFSRYPVPMGELHFPRKGLNAFPLLTPSSIVLWRGSITYATTRTFAVWARVRLAISKDALVAGENINAGQAIAATQMQTAMVKQFPFLPAQRLTVESLSGRIARRTISYGQLLTPALFMAAKEVLRGDQVQVRVKTGSTEIKLPAVAESTGGLGDSVLVKNPSSGKSFRAVVEGKNQVVVAPTGGL